MEPLILDELRQWVDENYVGFHPNTGSVKPVHLAKGMFRAALGKTMTAEGLKRLAYVVSAKGQIPSGNGAEDVLCWLHSSKAAEEDITQEQLNAFRIALQKLVGADKALFGDSNKVYGAFTAASFAFVTKKDMHEDSGEFIGDLLNRACQELTIYVSELLRKADDPISMAFLPVRNLSTGTVPDVPGESIDWSNPLPLDDIVAFKLGNHGKANNQLDAFIKSLEMSGKCLKTHLDTHPNPLTQMRLFNFFGCLCAIRWLGTLATIYCEEDVRPVLLDFSGKPSSCIARTSVLCYSQFHKAISRFYAWGYAQALKERNLTVEELLQSPVPCFKMPSPTGKKTREPKNAEGLNELWQLAKESIKNKMDDDEAFRIFGEVINEMTILEAENHPVGWIRKLGTEIGLLYPPTNLHTDKRFALSDDMLETILRCCVEPDETLLPDELRNRLWERFRIVIGGSPKDVERLSRLGGIVYADADALVQNFADFTRVLDEMELAETLPDGILRIGFGGLSK